MTDAIFEATMIIRACDQHLEVSTPAKVNFFLELMGRRRDNFHEIETVMSSISLFDHLQFTPRTDSGIRLTLSNLQPGKLPGESDRIPTDHRNLVVRAVELVRSEAQQEHGSDACRLGMDIHLWKRIPSAAGLGGASGNAAGALVAASRIWNLNWSRDRLADLAAQLGSDIAFFLTGGTAVCRGRGELIEPLSVPAGVPIVVANPGALLSTRAVFDKVSDTQSPVDCQEIVRGLRNGRTAEIGRWMFNRLQEFAEPMAREIGILRTEFARVGCSAHQMSGSGASYFGVFPTCRAAQQAFQTLSCRLPDVRIFYSQTLGRYPLGLND